jgi:NTP pyrophosphatase (non-canonical NTP hydrolase)
MEKNNMKLNDYVKWTGNTCANLNNLFFDNTHMIWGMMTEVGELTDAYKKGLAYGAHIDMVNVAEEIGDLLFYIASFCRINGLNLEEILEKNVAKLEARYPHKFTQHHANNRDLKNERSILEGKHSKEA